jgi:hypothetical protein
MDEEKKEESKGDSEDNPPQGDEIKRLLVNDQGEIRNLTDIYLTVIGTEIYKSLDPIGHRGLGITRINMLSIMIR